MKILIIHQHFRTPEQGGPLRSYYLSQGLRQKGYQVEVITAHNQSGEFTQLLEGVRVHYLPVFYENQLRFWSRIFAFAKFAVLALNKAKTIKDLDLCYALSTPLTVGWVALKLKSQKRIPYIFEVGDLWPEAPIQMGILSNPLLIAQLRRFEKKVYQQALQIVALSPDIKGAVKKVAPQRRVSVVTNMADCQYFEPRSVSQKQFGSLDLQGKFTILYGGAVGRANHLEFLISAARYSAKEDPDIHFVVAGQGSELNRITSMANDLQNITFLDYLPKDQFKELLQIIDAVYISFAPLPVLQTGCPNKFFDGLAAGKLIILNFKGWLRQVVENHQVGIYADPEQPENFPALIKKFKDNRDILIRFQKNARALAAQQYSKELALDKLDKIIRHSSHQLIDSAVYTGTE